MPGPPQEAWEKGLQRAAEVRTEGMLARRTAFLEAYRTLGTLYHAAHAIGVHPTVARGWVRDDPEFKEQLEEAKAQVADLAEQELLDIALTGKKASFVQFKALELVLRAKRREQYGEAVAVTGSGGGPIQVERRELVAHFVADVVRVLDQGVVRASAIEGDGQSVGSPKALPPGRT